MGAGTYAALVPIYRGIDDPPAVFSPPSVAAAIVVELGRSALAVILAIGAVMVVVLFRRALARGRDSLYAAAGSGYAVLMMLGIFCDGGLGVTSFCRARRRHFRARARAKPKPAAQLAQDLEARVLVGFG